MFVLDKVCVTKKDFSRVCSKRKEHYKFFCISLLLAMLKLSIYKSKVLKFCLSSKQCAAINCWRLSIICQ